MSKLVIYGAGALARETVEVVRRMSASGQDITCAAFLVDQASDAPESLLGLPILTDLGRFDGDDSVRFCIAIGDPEVRARAAARLERRGARLATIIDPLVWIGATSTVGEGSILFGHSSITVDSKLGRCSLVNPGCTIAHDNLIGDFATLSPGVHLAGYVWCDDRCFFGTGATVRPKVRIGKGAYIGAGAVVIKDVAADTTVAGNPARPLAPSTKS